MNQLLADFAHWLSAQPASQGLIGSFYMWNWIESTHVLTLMVFLGMLFVIDLRMLGLTLTNVPAATISKRLNWPMIIGFIIMVATGLILYYANAVHETQSIWFRLKIVVLVLAGINAWLFHRALNKSVDTWGNDPVPPKRIRIGAGLSMSLWALVIIFGRLMAYNWYDCENDPHAIISWAVGCQYYIQ